MKKIFLIVFVGFAFSVFWPTVALVAELEAELVWSEEQKQGISIQYAAYINGKWQTPQTLINDGEVNILPTLTSDTSQNKLMVWVVLEQDNVSTLYYKFKTAGNWGKIRRFPFNFKTNLAPVVVCDKENVFWLFWAANNGNHDDIYSSCWKDGHWNSPVKMNKDNSVPDILPDAWLDQVGRVWVSWQQMDSEGNYHQMRRGVKNSKRTGDVEMTATQRGQRRERAESFDHSMRLPDNFKTKGRSVIHFPKDGQNQFKTIQGTE